MAGADTSADTSAAHKLTFITMTGMVVGSMVGAGVFSLPRRFAQETGVTGALIAWLVAGAGMLMLAFVFQTLAVRKPNLDAGVYAYAEAGFGEYLGFFSAFGHGRCYRSSRLTSTVSTTEATTENNTMYRQPSPPPSGRTSTFPKRMPLD